MKRVNGWAVLAVLLSLALVAGAWAGPKKKLKKGERDPSWFACSRVSDCTVTSALCGDPSGVNVRHLRAYDRWVESRQNRIRCAGGILAFNRAVVACEEGVCIAGLAPADYAGQLSAAMAGSCGDLSDCIVSHGVCGDPLGLQSSKRKVWEKKVRRQAVAVDCAGSVRRSSRAMLACENHRCVAGPAPAGSAKPIEAGPLKSQP